VADFDEASGQDVKQEAANELDGMEGDGLVAAGTKANVAEPVNENETVGIGI